MSISQGHRVAKCLTSYKCYLTHRDKHVYHLLVVLLYLGIYVWGSRKFGKWHTKL